MPDLDWSNSTGSSISLRQLAGAFLLHASS